jgi:D-aminoacyl-tRNA deacylase
LILIVISEPDPASVNIQTRLLELGDWREQEGLVFFNNPVYELELPKAKFGMVRISPKHMDYDNIDMDLKDQLGIQPETIIYASRHKSASGLNTLTVHPIGNFGEASEYGGGRSEELVVSSPNLMTAAYRLLNSKIKSSELEYSVSFEATHHGPYLNIPTFFIEIGSDEIAWADTEAAKVIAETILDLKPDMINKEPYPVAIGVGGGHYAPRISDVARAKKVGFGHIIPSYAIGNEVDKIISDKLLSRAIEKTPEVKLVYFHRKTLKKPVFRKLKDWFESQGLEVVRTNDLEDI